MEKVSSFEGNCNARIAFLLSRDVPSFILIVGIVDFTGIFMVDGCCVARWHLGKAKGKCQK